MFLTTPSRTSPSCSWLTSSVRCSARASSRIARRETTMLPRGRSILRIANGCSRPIKGPTSRTGRMSTWLPGRKAEAPPGFPPAGLLAADHRLAQRVLDPLQEDLDGVADLQRRLVLAGGGELL